ncbi:MAG: hypothetical protein ACRD1R_11045 [Acidobacteriota bacterium]
MPVLREVVEAPGLVLRSDGEILILVVDHAVQEDRQLSDQVEEIWRSLHELVKTLSGACKLAGGHDQHEVRLQNVFYEDHNGQRTWLPISGRGNITLPPLGSVQPEQEAQIIGAALKSPAVAKALRLFDGPADWVNLYRMLEVVEDAVGGRQALVALGWISKGDLERFTISSNHPRVSGDRARHGVMKGTPKRRMDLQEARALLKGLLRRLVRAPATTAAPENKV